MPAFLKNILWTTDFSDEAQEALGHAALFAKTFHSRLSALHIVPDVSSFPFDTSLVIQGVLTRRMGKMKKEAASRLESIAETKGLEFKKIIIKEGTAAKKIIETASKEKVDLIVMGRRGLSAIEKLFIGSVANQVLRSSPVPVLMTKKRPGKLRVKKILVPTDFSDQEEVERNFAWKIAGGFGASLTLLHVLELHDYEFTPRELDEMFKAVMARFKKRKKRERKALKVNEDVYRAVNASIGIVDYAETNKFDLIVISTCVQSKLKKFFLGSTTEKVVSYTSIPVFAIPPSWCVE